MGRLKSVNNGQTTLNANITAAATSFTVASASVLPNAPFKISIDGEIMEVTAIDKASNTLTSVLRGQEGTAAATHNTGASVENRWTAGTHAELTDVTHTHDGGAGNGPKLNPATAFTYVPPAMTTAALTYYVDNVNGNDANAGTAAGAGNALKTIQAAINKIPQIINHAVTINVAAGTYNEDITISGFAGSGGLSVIGGADLAGAANFTVRSFFAKNISTQLTIKGFTVTAKHPTAGHPIIAVGCKDCSILNVVNTFVDATAMGVYFIRSNGSVSNSTFSNKNAAIYAGVGSLLSSDTNSGANNAYGLFAEPATIVSKNGTQPAASNAANNESAGKGIITAGVQNPWGDNTFTNRVSINAGLPSAQNISALVWTKLDFSNEYADNRGNFDPALKRFTAPHSGHYIIIVSALYQNVPAVNDMYLAIYRGTSQVFVTQQRDNYNTRPVLHNDLARLIYLNAGEYIEIMVYVTQPVSISADSGYTQLWIQQF